MFLMSSILNSWNLSALAFLMIMSSGCSSELASKPEWSILQSVEQEYRDQTFKTPGVLRKQGYKLLGVQGREGRHVWILLNPKSSPFYKQMPQGPYDIDSELVKMIRSSGDASETVLECLSSHVSKE